MSPLNKCLLLIIASVLVAISVFFLFSGNKQREQNLFPSLALVLPHNPLFNQKIDQILLSSVSEKINTIIILGPNHKDVGPHIISNQNYLAKKLEIKVDENLIETEHSIKVLEPLIRRHYPKAEIIPFIFRRGLSLEKILSFGQKLKDNLNLSQSLLIGSIDFAHYLDENEAQKNDQETLTAINKFAYQDLLQFGPEHLDCSSCLITLLELTKKAEPIVLDHSFSSGTSYFFLSFQSRNGN